MVGAAAAVVGAAAAVVGAAAGAVVGAAAEALVGAAAAGALVAAPLVLPLGVEEQAASPSAAAPRPNRRSMSRRETRLRIGVS